MENFSMIAAARIRSPSPRSPTSWPMARRSPGSVEPGSDCLDAISGAFTPRPHRSSRSPTSALFTGANMDHFALDLDEAAQERREDDVGLRADPPLQTSGALAL